MTADPKRTSPRVSRPPPAAARAGLLAFLLLVGAGLATAGPGVAQESGDASGADPDAERSVVLLVRVDSAIHAVVADRLADAVETAGETGGAAALVVELDTPGGSLEATRRIAKTLLGSPVPVIVWVGPSGARAASAGFVILLAADVAAMAPGTQTGAAHPVTSGGGDIEGEMGRKVEQDTLALVRSLAQEAGRDAELSQEAVAESRAFTAQEALDAGLVDVVAPDLRTLLARISDHDLAGSELGVELPLAEIASAEIVELEMGLAERFLGAVAHPQIAGILLALGMLGLYVEISNPGLIVPGMVGAIFVILGFYALSVLPINYAGLALVGLALILFVAEILVPTFGVLTAGGAVSLVLGLMIMFRDAGPAFEMPWHTLAAIGLGAFVLVLYTSRKTLAMRRQRPTTGAEGMVGEVGTASSDLALRDGASKTAGGGKVRVHGEIWRAELEPGAEPVAAGSPVEVVEVDGLLLRVRPTRPTASEDPAHPNDS